MNHPGDMESLLHMLPLASEWLKITGSVEGLNTEIMRETLRNLEPPDTNLLLISEFNELRLALLFQCAVSYASEGGRVWFIRRHPLEQIPMCVHGMVQPDGSVLKNVKFMYYSNVRELMGFCASIHTQTLLPDAIIVDDLQHFVQQSQDSSSEQGLAKLCCTLKDAAQYIEQKRSKTIPLLMCIDNRFKSLDTTLWKLSIQTATVVQTLPVCGDTAVTYELRMRIKDETVVCRFQVRDSSLMLCDLQLHTH